MRTKKKELRANNEIGETNERIFFVSVYPLLLSK